MPPNKPTEPRKEPIELLKTVDLGDRITFTVTPGREDEFIIQMERLGERLAGRVGNHVTFYKSG